MARLRLNALVQLGGRFLLAALTVFPILPGCNQEGTPGPRKAASTTAVKTVEVEQQLLQRTVTQPATVHAFHRSEIRPRVGGYVSTVHAEIGDVVAVGAPLATIAVPELNRRREVLLARIERGQSAQQRASSEVELATASVRSAEARRAQVASELAQVEASVAAAEAEFARTQDLVERRSLESRVLDEVRKRRDSELAKAKAAQSAIQSAEADVVVAKAELSAAQAGQKIAAAETRVVEKELAELDELIGFAQLVSPLNGVVTARSIDPGDLMRDGSAANGQAPVFVIDQLNQVRVHIPVPEADAAFIQPEDSVRLRFPSFPAEEPLEATVTRTSRSLDPSTRTMLVEVVVDNPDGKLIPGMFGEATITVSTSSSFNVLPARAVRFDETGGAYVYLLDEAERVSIVSVETGFDDGRVIAVTSGLTAGQRVIDAHLQRFSDGQTVTVLNGR